MDGNTELLNYIYQNSEMGIAAIDQLNQSAKDDAFLKQLNTQRKEYTAINKQAREMLHERGHTEKDLSAMTQLASHFVIGAKTLADSSTAHMAEMMMKGSTMGIIEAAKNLKKYDDADKPVLSLAEKLLRTEESNVEHIKPFLS
jgi:hypothetical protein